MARERSGLLNRLASKLPESLLVDATWLKAQGYSSQLQHQYVTSGWLEQPARSVFRRPRGVLSWQQVVISLQTILNASPLVIGGRTALELQGYAHYLAQSTSFVYLYGPKAPPGWVGRQPLDVRFIYRNDQRLVANKPVAKGLDSLKWNVDTGEARDVTSFDFGSGKRLLAKGGVLDSTYQITVPKELNGVR